MNDPTNSELIRWSDSGDSFYGILYPIICNPFTNRTQHTVLDHERFAREVLGRWFKHENFSSFVRQLNMYGFHKIPHLQQGVLKSDNEAQFWNFEHQNFHRGQPDLLCLIQRKKQAPQVDEHGQAQIDMTPHNNISTSNRSHSPAISANLSSSQLLDINSIVSGIAAIKRHQTAISTDLNELKTSNAHLWQEAMASRERHQKHQDTINRILKFLAGVFGQGAGAGSASGVGVGREEGRRDGPRMMPQRLMIGDGRENKRKGIVEIVDDHDAAPNLEDSPESNEFMKDDSPRKPLLLCSYPFSEAILSDRFASVDTTVTRPSQSPKVTSPPKPNDSPRFEPAKVELSTPQNYFPPSSIQQQHTYSNNDDNNKHNQQLIANGNANGANGDALLQAAFTQMLQSPTQMQRLLQSLASQGINPVAEAGLQSQMPPPEQYQQQQYAQEMQPYGPQQIDYSRFENTPTQASFPQFTQSQQSNQQQQPLSTQNSQPQAPLISPPIDLNLSPFIDNETRLQKTYRDAAEIEEDVNALHTSINSLIESLGLDPGVMQSSSSQAPEGTQVVNPSDMEGTGTDPMVQDFDFDAFLTDLTKNGDVNPDYSQFADKLPPSSNTEPGPSLGQQEQFSTLLDEVNSVHSNSEGPASPVIGSGMHTFSQHPSAPNSPIRISPGKRGSKRKSGVAGIGAPMAVGGEPSQTKTRRKK